MAWAIKFNRNGGRGRRPYRYIVEVSCRDGKRIDSYGTESRAKAYWHAWRESARQRRRQIYEAGAELDGNGRETIRRGTR